MNRRTFVPSLSCLETRITPGDISPLPGFPPPGPATDPVPPGPYQLTPDYLPSIVLGDDQQWALIDPLNEMWYLDMPVEPDPINTVLAVPGLGMVGPGGADLGPYVPPAPVEEFPADAGGGGSW